MEFCKCRQPKCSTCGLTVFSSIETNPTAEVVHSTIKDIVSPLKADFESIPDDVKRAFHFVLKSHGALLSTRREFNNENKNMGDLFDTLCDEVTQDPQPMIDFLTILKEGLEMSTTKTNIQVCLGNIQNYQSEFPLSQSIDESPDQRLTLNGFSTAVIATVSSTISSYSTNSAPIPVEETLPFNS